MIERGDDRYDVHRDIYTAGQARHFRRLVRTPELATGYVYRTNDATPEFWSTWQIRIVATAGATIALAIVQWTLQRRGVRSTTSVL